MPKFVIERNIPGASKLSRQQLGEIAAKSNAVVAGSGRALCLGRRATLPATRSTASTRRKAPTRSTGMHSEGGFPADKVTEIAAMIGPQTANGA